MLHRRDVRQAAEEEAEKGPWRTGESGSARIAIEKGRGNGMGSPGRRILRGCDSLGRWLMSTTLQLMYIAKKRYAIERLPDQAIG